MLTKQLLFFVSCSTGYVGEGSCSVELADTPEGLSDSDIHILAMEHASSYGRDGSMMCTRCGAEGDDDECTDCGGSMEWEDSDRVEGAQEPYDPDKHDRKRCGGGSFLEEYPLAIKGSDGLYFVLESKDPDLKAYLANAEKLVLESRKEARVYAEVSARRGRVLGRIKELLND